MALLSCPVVTLPISELPETLKVYARALPLLPASSIAEAFTVIVLPPMASAGTVILKLIFAGVTGGVIIWLPVLATMPLTV